MSSSHLAELLVNRLSSAKSVARFACVNSEWLEAATTRCSTIVVVQEDHLAGAIRLAGPALRKLILDYDAVLSAETLCFEGRGLALLPNSSVCIHIRHKGVDESNYDDIEDIATFEKLYPVIKGYDYALTLPAIKELRVSSFAFSHYDAGLMRNPKLLIVGTVLITTHLNSEQDMSAMLRHQIDTFDVRHRVHGTLLQRTSARHVILNTNYLIEPDNFRDVAANLRIQRLTFRYGNENDLTNVAVLANPAHVYGDGFVLKQAAKTAAEMSNSSDDSDNSYNVDDDDDSDGDWRENYNKTQSDRISAIITSLTRAFSDLRVGKLLYVDAIAHHLGVHDDALLTSIAECAWRNEGLNKLRVHLWGNPEPGSQVRELLRMPAHISSVRLTSGCEHPPIKSALMKELWMWDALEQCSLPGVEELVITCNVCCIACCRNTRMNGKGVGRRLASFAPHLRKITLKFPTSSTVKSDVSDVREVFSLVKNGSLFGRQMTITTRGFHTVLSWSRA